MFALRRIGHVTFESHIARRSYRQNRPVLRAQPPLTRSNRPSSHSSRSADVPVGQNDSQPLRILYCGSDDFSSASLEALHKESLRPSGHIASIDVVCRPGKPYGRGLKSIRDPEIKGVAKQMGLSVHQLETFAGWKLPEFRDVSSPRINLVIAVSFGLFIPSTLLKEAKYAGINLHPSMLPKYRGPAPLHWALLNGEKKTGMSLQTLHHKSFDKGILLDQTPWPGIDIPESCDYDQLVRIMRPLGAEMLVNAIRKRLYLLPARPISCAIESEHGREGSKYAPKIKTADKLLQFAIMDSSRIQRMSRTFESTWAFAAVAKSSSELTRRRVIFQGPFDVHDESSKRNERMPEIVHGLPYWPFSAVNQTGKPIDSPLLVNTIDGKTISIESFKVEGHIKMPAYRAALKYKLIDHASPAHSTGAITFHDVLTA